MKKLKQVTKPKKTDNDKRLKLMVIRTGVRAGARAGKRT